MPIAYAINGAKYVVERLGITEHLVAGSIRRRVQMVKDIELVVPMPAKGEPDVLLEAIRRQIVVPGYHGEEYAIQVEIQPSLLGPASTRQEKRRRPMIENAIGVAVKGVKEDFRYCQLRIAGCADPSKFINVDIFRYDQGENGNRGWIELIRTGPADFGQKALGRWKQLNPGAYSQDGYPHRADGVRVAVPTEDFAFQLLEWPWIDPWARQ